MKENLEKESLNDQKKEAKGLAMENFGPSKQRVARARGGL
jgi:hypothetical protein